MRSKILIMAILGILLVSSLCIVPTNDNSSYINSYGSSNVGAETITFDSNGGTGGYSQKVLSGNDVYFPTEYKASGTASSGYTQVSKSGSVLLGWSTDGKTVTYYPGQSYEVTSSKTFKAVWGPLEYDYIEKFSGSSYYQITEAEHMTVLEGTKVSLEVDNEEQLAYMKEAGSGVQGTIKYVLTTTHNGTVQSKEMTAITGSMTLDWVTVDFTAGSYSFSGTINEVGIHEISLNLQTRSNLESFGQVDDIELKWYVSVADGTYDPSIMRHVTTEDGTVVGYGPYHTAIQLPDANNTSAKQNGWYVYVNQALTTYPMGGAYTIIRDLTLQPSYYSSEEIENMAGVIAYNANGGYYKGQFATVVAPGGTVTLTDGSIVTKSGRTFVGWNTSGTSSNAIYPAGYSFKLDEDTEYTELKAVWSTSNQKAILKYINTSDGLLSSTLSLCKGYDYVHPTSASEPSGYTFKGWSTTQYTLGEGTPIDEKQVCLSSDMTFYTVFEKNKEGSKTVTVTFVGRTSVISTEKILSGETVNAVNAPDVDNMSFDAWYHNGDKWDFGTAVTGDMTLQAKYIKIFDLQTEKTSVKVILNVPSSSTRVTYSSDGHTETFVGEAPKAHTLEAGTSGYVTVTVTTQNGEYTSKCSYIIENDGGNGGDENKETVNIDLTYFVLGLAIVGLIVFAYRRGYL